MMYLPNYKPAAMYPQPDPPGEVPLHVFNAAILAGASHLSADGLTAYTQRFNLWFEAEYSGGVFNSWWAIEALPAEAVKLE